MSRRHFPNALHQLGNSIGRSEAVVTITAEINPALWTPRKKNIILRALRTGVISCGRETARFINDLVKTFCDTNMPSLSYWHTCLESEHVKPERFEELIAYTCAWIRMKEANYKPRSEYDRALNWAESRFINGIKEGITAPTEIPMPSNLTHKQRGEFIQEYIKVPDDSQTAQREALAQKIENNEPILFTFHN